jgi:hypothetical protein
VQPGAGHREPGHPGPAGQHHGRHHGQAEARLDEPEHGVHLAALDGEPGLDAGLSPRAEGGVAQVVALPEHHERAGGQVGDVHLALAARRRVRRWRGYHELFAQQRQGLQRRVALLQRQHDQGAVEFALRQVADQVAGPALDDPQLDAGERLVEPGQGVGQQAAEQRRGRADPDAAAAQPGQVLHLAAGGVHVGEDAAGQREQRLAGRGEGDVAPRPAQQLGPQVALQGRDLLGQGGLGDPQLSRGVCEVPYFRDGQEVSKLLDLHGK